MFEKLAKKLSSSAENTDLKVLSDRVVKLGVDPKGLGLETLQRLEETLIVPVPYLYSYWEKFDQSIRKNSNQNEKKDKLFGIFKKKILPQQQISELRDGITDSPGNTRIKILKLKKKYPDNPTLDILSAVCREQMMVNSAAKKRDRLVGLRIATREAAKGLSNDGISIYNCESFLKIYFSMIDHLKRNQVNFYGVVNQEEKLAYLKEHVTVAMQYRELVAVDQEKLTRIIEHLKNQFKTSSYFSSIDSKLINEAVKAIANGDSEKKLSMGTAKEIISSIYACGIIFAHIPILSSLVDQILEHFSNINVKFHLRKISIKTIRSFMKLKIASVLQDGDEMRSLGNEIFKENRACVQAMQGFPLRHAYESDPFMNLAFLAELVVELYKPEEQKKLMETATIAMQQVIENDRSTGQKLSRSAKGHLTKLTYLKTELRIPSN